MNTIEKFDFDTVCLMPDSKVGCQYLHLVVNYHPKYLKVNMSQVILVIQIE
jgi:hypothetical protein